MNKKNSIKTTYNVIYTLGILAILAFGVIIMPLTASADMPGYVTPYGVTGYNTRAPSNSYVSQDFYPAYNSTYSSNPNTTTSANQTNSTTNATSTTENTNTSNTTTENLDTTENTSSEGLSNLASNVTFGSSGIYPSGIIQWIFFAILVLLIVILVRKIFGFEEKYHSTPMKQA